MMATEMVEWKGNEPVLEYTLTRYRPCSQLHNRVFTAVFSRFLARPNDTIGYPVLDE